MYRNFQRKALSKIQLFCIVLLLFLSHTAAMAETLQTSTDAWQLLLTAHKKASSIKTLSANFRQKKVLALLQDALISSGHFCFEREKDSPISILWEYTEPINSGFQFTEGQGTLWVAGRDQKRLMQKQEAYLLKAIAAEMETWLVLDPERMSKRYEIQKKDSAAPSLVVRPKETGGLFTSTTVVFDPTLTYITELHFQEKNNDQTILFLTDFTSNTDLPDFCAHKKSF